MDIVVVVVFCTTTTGEQQRKNVTFLVGKDFPGLRGSSLLVIILVAHENFGMGI